MNVLITYRRKLKKKIKLSSCVRLFYGSQNEKKKKRIKFRELVFATTFSLETVAE